MKLLLVDLDDTLIDTATLKAEIFGKLASTYHYDLNSIKVLYELVKKTHGVDHWLQHFTAQLEQQTKQPAAQLEATVLDCLNHISINHAVVDFLTQFDGYKVLFSYGDDAFQRKKIDITKLHVHVDEIMITQQPKFQHLASLIHDKELIIHGKAYTDVTILDNHAGFLAQINHKFPWIKTIHPQIVS